LYYVRAYAINSVGIGYGDQVTFTTTQVAIPVLTTTAVSTISQTTAVSGGNITVDNGGSVTSRGVCWSTNQNPTIIDSKTADGTGTGIFTSSITGLLSGTTYYVRAYATNSAGTGYGSQISFTTVGLPTVTTTPITIITNTTASSGGNVTAAGGATVTDRGVCWSLSQNPTISDNKTSNGTGTGSFTISITGLVSGTSYYARAYATNSAGTSYGNEVSFTTSITDIDGNVYQTIKIGNQVWMAENLKTTKYRNGDLIGTTNPTSLDISSESAPKYQWAYGGNENNVPIYGRLYTWEALNDSRNIAPAGWHVARDDEWTTLTTNLGGLSVAGGKLKESGTNHWNSPNTGATNETGFNALPGGLRRSDGLFFSIGDYGSWWTSSGLSINAWVYTMNNTGTNVFRGNDSIRHGFSVRCVRDN